MTEDRSSIEALRQAIDKIGSQAAMARILGIAQPSVWRWVNAGKRLPAEHVLAVEAATGVSKHRLRPDIYGPDPAESAGVDIAIDASMVPAR